MSFNAVSFEKLPLKLLLLSLLLALGGAAWAQDEDADEEQTDETGEIAEEVRDLGTIQVTGSRLQRETYTSIAPLQVITAEGQREVGLIDAAEILQKSTAAAGQQIDLTFSGFVLDNGPGASTVSLRGLGSARTLILVNGRRLAPSGVEGAPVSPDLNLIPASLVRQYDVLLDGASSVYGSDAVAGVTNILLRKDFDGLEFDVFYNSPDQSRGNNYTASALWGKNFDRGFVGVAVEYVDNEEVRLRDREWTAGCDKHFEVTEAGDYRTQEQFYNNIYGMEWDECRLGLLASRVIVPGVGSIYHTPGFSNGGWPDFSESSLYGFGIDSNLDGVADLSFRDYDLNGKDGWQNGSLFPANDRVSVMGYGEYTLEGEMNNTPYFEVLYSDRSFETNAGVPQLFPWVPANNPYSICNPNGIRGVDCGLALDALYDNPGFRQQFSDRWESLCASFGFPKGQCTPGLFGLYNGALGPQEARPIVSVMGDRNWTRTTMDQTRIVLGMKGDLPQFDWGPMNGWQYDVGMQYTDSSGTAHRPGIRGDRLDYALGWYSSTGTPCDGSQGFSSAPRHFGRELFSDTATGCVPVDLFHPSLYPVGVVVGDFATSAERDYVFDSRDFDTEYKQLLVGAYANGFLWDLPGGTMTAGFGFEWRNDDINSIPDNIARDGLFWGFFSDGGAVGDKDTTEFFGEVELPLLAGKPGAQELTVNLSARWTDDELYGSDTTYSAKIGWRPVDSLLIRGTWGTSFRAPSLREVFLLPQTGFTGVFDPCFIPQDALNPITGGYDPDLDDREEHVLENCRRTGVDPTALDNGGFNTFSTEVAAGGFIDLEAETSDSITYGFAFEQPWFETFDLTIGATYYQIEVENTIVEPSAQYIVNDCYYDVELDSTFCGRITRDQNGVFDIIDRSFLNRDNETVRGVDVNINFDKQFQIGERGVNLGVDVVLNHSKEASERFLDDEGNEDFDDDNLEWGFPDWKGQLGLRADVGDWRVTWVANYVGDVIQDVDGVDGLSTALVASDTCMGPAYGDVLCRDYGDTDEYVMHSASVYYRSDQWNVGFGVRNVFDTAPPWVDGTEVLAINNTPIGYGYDLNGRTYFLNLRYNLGSN